MFKFYTKLVVLCVVIGIAPLLILGWLTFNIANSIKDDLISANTQILFQTQRRIEDVLKIIDNSMIQFINSPIVNKVISVPRDNENFDEFRDAAASMYRMQTYEIEVSDMYLISNLHRWIISNSLMNNIDDIDLTAFIAHLNGVDKTSFWYNMQNGGKENLNQRIVRPSGIILIKKIPVNTIDGDGLAIIELPAYSIKKLISGENLPHKMLILDEYGYTVSSDDGLFADSPDSYRPLLSKITAAPEGAGYFFEEIDSQDYMVIFQRSRYNHWTYISFTPASLVFHKSNSIKSLTVLILAGVFTFVLLLSLKGSQELYSPVKKLYKAIQQNSAESAGKNRQSRDEFKAIGDTLERLVITNKKYQKEIEAQSDTVKLFFFRRLLQGEIEKKQIRKNLDSYSIPYRHQSLALMGIKIDSFENTYFQDDKELLLFAVGNILAELVEGSQGWKPVLLKEEYFVLLLGSEPHGQFREAVSGHIQAIQSAVSLYLNLSISVGVSCLFDDIEQIHMAKAECDEALKYCIKSGSGSVTFMDAIKTSKFTNSVSLSDQKNELLLAIKSGKTEEAVSCFEKCLHAITAPELDINMFQFEIISLVIDIVKTIQAVDTDFDFSIDGFLSGFNSIDGIVKYIEFNLILSGCNKYGAYWLNVKKSIVEQVVEYIHLNLTKDISLEGCARFLNYNANYISRVFKAEMSLNFIDYVTSQKMELAKEWLLHTDLSITEISEKLSYHNPQNFIRSFKKLTGMTPGHYRNAEAKG